MMLKPACNGCGSSADLYASNCRHLTLCPPCGKSMMERASPCPDCRLPLSRLIREYNVKAPVQSKQYFVTRFLQGEPMFAKNAGWHMQREGLQGRQLTDALREKYKGKPWLLEDDEGQQYQGQHEGGQQATYYLLMMHGKDFLAIPAGAWYNFHKMTQYKQLTLEEAEEQMKNRRKTADGYQRWMMKAANTGATAFGETEKIDSGGRGRRKQSGDDDDTELSDKGEEDVDDEEARKSRLGMNKKTGDDDGEDPARGGDFDLDEEEPERGDDWEHEETFTDDDEAVGNDPEEREDQAPELPAPPEIKQEEEEEEEREGEEEGSGGLSQSGKELKKLLGKSAGLEESSDDFDEDDDDADLDNEDLSSPVLAPSRRDLPKEEPVDATPMKLANVLTGRTASALAISKGKRKAIGDDVVKGTTPTTVKKVKTETVQEEAKPVVKKEQAPVTTTKTVVPPAVKPVPPTGPVTEEEIKAVLKQMGPIKSQDLVARFKTRLRTPEDKAAFAGILKKISRIQKTNGANFIVLRENI